MPTAVAVENIDWRLRGGFTAPTVTDDVRASTNVPGPVIPRLPQLGLNKIGSLKPKLRLAHYVDTSVAVPPAVSRPHPGFGWGMLANDSLGDCVCAMILHSIEDFHLDAGTPPPAFADQDAILLYEHIGGYKPGDPSTDQGCDENVAMEKWLAGLPKTSDGVEHEIVATLAVDVGNHDLVKRGIYGEVALQLGAALPITAQGQTEWEVVGDPNKDADSEPGSWGGHGIPAREYDADTVKVVTWGAELLMTWPWWDAYVQEAHAVVTKEMLSNTGVSPEGLAWDDLVADIKKL